MSQVDDVMHTTKVKNKVNTEVQRVSATAACGDT